jgi:hypothetical protein
VMLIHPGSHDLEFHEKMLSTCPNEAKRFGDTYTFTHSETKDLIENEGIHLIGWKKLAPLYSWSP